MDLGRAGTDAWDGHDVWDDYDAWDDYGVAIGSRAEGTGTRR